MKFKRTKLTALAMSVLMAASVMPTTVLADNVSPAYQVLPGTVAFTYDETGAGKHYVEWKEVIVEDAEVDGVEEYRWMKETPDVIKREAGCEVAPADILTITIDGQVYNSNPNVTGKELGHDKEYVRTRVDVKPTCTTDGIGFDIFECTRCGKIFEEPVEDDLEKYNHKFTTWVEKEESYNLKKDAEGEIIFDAEGNPTLIDPMEDGFYFVNTYQDCTVAQCDYEAKIIDSEKVMVLATAYAKTAVTKWVNVDETYITNTFGTDAPTLAAVQAVAVNTIELKDCTKDGSYTITYYNKSELPIYEKTFVIPAHHLETAPVVEFASEEDKELCKVVNTEDGYTVINESCYLDITYYEVTHCTAKGCPNKKCDTTKYLCDNTSLKEVNRKPVVAEHSGDHVINTYVETAIDNHITAELTFDVADKFGTKEFVKEEGYVYYPWLILKDQKTDKASYINVSANTATCTEDGTVNVEYQCKVCKQIAKTETYKTQAMGHDYLNAVEKEETLVAATCTTPGSAMAITRCGRENCDAVLEERGPIASPRLPHSNEIFAEPDVYTDVKDDDKDAMVRFVGDLVVDNKAAIFEAADKDEEYRDTTLLISGKYGKDFVVTAEAYTVCKYCGGHDVVVDNDVEITVNSVKKQGKHCQEGAINLTATYVRDDDGKEVSVTDSFEYYTTMEAFDAQIDHTPGTPVKENVVDATATAPGSYDLVEYCKYCGVEISRTPHVVGATGDIVLPAVTGLKATATGMNKVTVSWDAAEGAVGYLVLKDGVQVGYTMGSTTFVDKAADANDFNYYWVVPFCKNAANEVVRGELSNYVWALGRVLGQAKNLVAVAGEEGVTLTWDAVANANGYVVLSKTGSNTAPFNTPIEVTDATCIDVAAEGLTFYWVYATYANEAGVVAAGAVSPFAWAIAQ